MLLTAAWLVLNVDVHAGNQTASTYAQPTVWEWQKARDRKYWPTLLRGEIAYGTEEEMAGAEQLGLQCLRRSKRVAALIAKLARKESNTNWRDAGQGLWKRNCNCMAGAGNGMPIRSVSPLEESTPRRRK